MMNMQQLLQTLSTQLGKPVALSPHGTVRLSYQNRLDLILETQSEFDLHFYGVLGEVPLTDAEGIYQRLLQAQLFWQMTGQTSFAIDAAHNQVLLQRHLDLRRIEPEDLVDAIQDFFVRLDRWTSNWNARGEDAMAAPSVTTVPPIMQSIAWIRG